MGLNIFTLGSSKTYTRESLLGGGAVVGKNVTISSITPIEGGNRVTFSYTLDNGTVKTSTMDVMDGIDGLPGKDGKDGLNGKDGQQGSDGIGISKIEKIGTVDLVDTYRITFTDNSTFDYEVKNGKDGQGGGIADVPIEKIKVNGELQTPVNKVVDITVPSIEGLTKDADLSTVAKSGSYEDLINKPTIPDITGLATETYVDNKVADYTKTVDLADVATSGSYNDLADKPTIPSLDGYATESYVTEQISNIPSVDLTDYAKKNEIPDVSGYITEEQLLAKDYADRTYVTEEIAKASTGGEIDLSSYLSKVEASETYVAKEDGKSLIADTEIERLASVDNYDDTQVNSDITALSARVKTVENEVPNLATKTYVGEQIANAEHLKREIVTVLPSDAEASDNIIYMLKVESATGNDKYKEYMKIDGTVQMVGDTSVDLTDYAKTVDIPTTVAELTDSADYAKKTDLHSHTNKTVLDGITSTKVSNWDSAKTHADSAHAPSNAQANVIETVKLNGSVLTPTDKAVNVTVPTKVSELTDGSDYAKTTDIPTSLPANGGNADTVNNHTVKSDVPENAVFTDTVYNDSSLSLKVTQNTNDISELKTADNVLSSRIDAFASLTEGSTTGDVELLDIRVKADGTTATSAGNAVREQFNELKSDVVLLDNLLKKTLAQEYDLKIAIDNMFKCAAYDGDSNYASAYENFKIACGLSDILYISAVFNGESAIAGTDAKDLDITVTGHYTDGETITLTGWKISGTVMVGTNIFTVVLGEFTTTVSVTGVKEPIPSEYTRCSYIKNSGTQYIKIPTKNMIAGTDKFIADFEINEDAGNDTMVFGGYTGNGTGRIGLNWKDGYINYNGANNWVYSQSGFELSPNIRAVAILDTKNGIAQLGESTSEFTPKSYTSSILCIFGYYNPTNTAQNKISMTLYRFKQYRNDELFTDLVPCLRNSDNVAGLYDLVDGVFYANAGSGTFEYEVASWA